MNPPNPSQQASPPTAAIPDVPPIPQQSSRPPRRRRDLTDLKQRLAAYQRARNASSIASMDFARDPPLDHAAREKLTWNEELRMREVVWEALRLWPVHVENDEEAARVWKAHDARQTDHAHVFPQPGSYCDVRGCLVRDVAA